MMTWHFIKFMGEIMSFNWLNKFRYLVCGSAISVLVACSSVSPYIDRKSDISLEKAKSIQINVSNMEAILKAFGEPYVRGLKNGNEMLIYVGNRDGQHSTLEIKFNEKGLVADYTFYEENPKRASK